MSQRHLAARPGNAARGGAAAFGTEQRGHKDRYHRRYGPDRFEIGPVAAVARPRGDAGVAEQGRQSRDRGGPATGACRHRHCRRRPQRFLSSAVIAFPSCSLRRSGIELTPWNPSPDRAVAPTNRRPTAGRHGRRRPQALRLPSPCANSHWNFWRASALPR
jgi:hypothetical protein